jgi:PmbA protein
VNLDILREAIGAARSERMDEAEAFLVRSRTMNVYVEDSIVKNLEEREDMGLAMRVSTDRRRGEASCTISNGNEIQRCAATAASLARVSDENPTFQGFPSSSGRKGGKARPWDEETASVDASTLASFAETIVNSVLSNDGLKVPKGLIRVAGVESGLLNTNGVEMTHRNTMVYLYFTAMTVGERPGEGESTQYSNRLGSLDAGEIGESLARGAKDSASAMPFRGEKEIPVFISPIQLASLLEYTVEFSVSGENVNRRRSRWANNLDQPVASPEMTIVDDPFDGRGMLCADSDDEGVPSQSKTIIGEGVLRNYLYDTYNAAKAGVESTGNGMRRSSQDSQKLYQRPVTVSPMNMVLRPGIKSESELLESFDEALYIDRFAYPQANSMTGGFGLEVRCARLLRKGETDGAYKHALLVGNMYTALERVVGVASQPVVAGRWILPCVGFEGMRLVGNPSP